MKRSISVLLGSAAAVALLNGCSSTPPDPNVERGPHGTIAYDVLVEASAPAKIEANGEMLGDAPLHLKIYGDKDHTFHDFGAYYYVIKAYPMSTNQFMQVRYFGTGRHGAPEDIVPSRVYFDMNQPPPPTGSQQAPPQVIYEDSPHVIFYGPPVYFGPRYYGPGPGFYFRGPLPPPPFFPGGHHH